MDLFILEVKRQMTWKRFMSCLLIPVILGGLWAWFVIGGETEGFMMTHCYEGLKGMAAIEAAAKDRSAFSGKMTVDNFQKSGEVFLKSKNGKDEIVMNDDLLKLAVYADTLVMQNYRLEKMSGEANPEAEKFPVNFGSHFYENENLYYQNLISKNAKNQAEREMASKMWNKVEMPYVYHGGFEAWRNGVEHIVMFAFVLLIIVGFFSSKIIAQDKECGLDEIMSSTKHGRNKLLWAKLLLPIIMAFSTYALGMGTYVAILKHYLPQNALETSTQVWAASILPYDLGEVMQKMIVSGLIGTLAVSAFTIFISSKVKKTSTAMSIIALVVTSGFLSCVMMDSNNPMVKTISLILPGSSVFSFSKFTMVPITSMFGRAFLSFELDLFISMIILFASLMIASWNYVRR